MICKGFIKGDATAISWSPLKKLNGEGWGDGGAAPLENAYSIPSTYTWLTSVLPPVPGDPILFLISLVTTQDVGHKYLSRQNTYRHAIN